MYFTLLLCAYSVVSSASQFDLLMAKVAGGLQNLVERSGLQGPTCQANDFDPDCVVKAGQQLGEYEARELMEVADPTWSIEAFESLPKKVWKLDIKPGTPEFARELYNRYGIVSKTNSQPSGDNLPLGLLKTLKDYRGKPGMLVSCELCHSSVVNGKVRVGLPNPFVNIERLLTDLDKSQGKKSRNTFKINPAGNSFVNSADHFGVVAAYTRKAGNRVDYNGVARILEGKHEDYNRDAKKAAYLKTPPWFTYRRKLSTPGDSGLYYTGELRKDAIPAEIQFAISFRDFANPQPLNLALARWQKCAKNYLKELPAPRYEGPVNADLAKMGERLYVHHCQRCHGGADTSSWNDAQGVRTGLHSESRDYPSFPGYIEDVGTDSKRLRYSDKLYNRLNQVGGTEPEFRPTREGYLAPPLDGIALRAPYGHNGSIPTLADLLKPAQQRPVKWAVTCSPNQPSCYDDENVGWRTTDGSDADTSAFARVYDPSKEEGLSNSGHEFGVNLDPEQKRMLLEFLKTL